jgi:hypothetical protein
MTDSGGAARPGEDQQALIDGESRPEKAFNAAVLPYLFFKAVPWAVYLWPDVLSARVLAAFVALSAVDVWLSRALFAHSLVGLRWGVAFPPAITYHFEPDPYVPAALDSNVFWTALIGGFLLAAAVALINCLRLRLAALAAAAVALMHGANLRLCFRCLARAT